MPRRALRILANDWGAWIPLVAVMSLTTALVGVCANQFAWTHSPEFLAATRAAGLRAEEFHVVSVSVYCCVALVAAFSLTVVGSATVVRCAPDFSRWRLLGATPAQVGATALAMTAVACGAGALVGSLASVPASFALVPWFNGLAAQGFPGGTGGFDPPFTASPGAWAASLVLSWLTCMLGSLGPSLRAARMRPVEALRSSGAGAQGASGHPVAAAAVAALALLLPVPHEHVVEGLGDLVPVGPDVLHGGGPHCAGDPGQRLQPGQPLVEGPRHEGIPGGPGTGTHEDTAGGAVLRRSPGAATLPEDARLVAPVPYDHPVEGGVGGEQVRPATDDQQGPASGVGGAHPADEVFAGIGHGVGVDGAADAQRGQGGKTCAHGGQA